MKYYIKERNNPQFNKPYYIGYGRLSAKEAKEHENTLYGFNIMWGYKTKKGYEDELQRLKNEGFSVGDGK